MSTEFAVAGSPRRWREQDGIIYFSVTSYGMTSEQWMAHFDAKGWLDGSLYHARTVLCSPDFKPTNGITTEIAVLRDTLFSDDDRITERILTFASEREFSQLNAEASCLIGDMFTEEELEAMGLSLGIGVMDGSFRDMLGFPRVLFTTYRSMELHRLRSEDKWVRDVGFAFAVSQAGSQS